MSAVGPHAGQSVLSAGKPLGRSHAVMVMVHGRNAAPQNILDMVPVFDRPDFTYLAPAAAGNTWYPYSFMTERERNEPWLSSALSVLQDLVGSLIAQGIRREHVILLGFSQGACLTGEFAVRNAARYGGVVLYSGGLIGPAGTAWDHAGTFDGTPVLLGCSDIDPHIPKARVVESATVFERMGAEVTQRIYPGMGHTVNVDEVRLTQDLMDQVLAARP
jgi:predicted esterase